MKLALAAFALLAGCAPRPPGQPSGPEALLDPARSRDDMGTLVDAADVLDISQKVVQSLRSHPALSGLLEKSRPVRIAVEPRELKNLTSMTGFSKRLFVNQLLTLLNRSAGEDFQFLDREEAPAAERERRLAGEVAGRGTGAPGPGEAPLGADLILAGRILEKLDRRPAAGGAVEETRSVQFSFSLVRVKDAVTLWSDSFFRVKQQVLGTVYS